MTVATVLRLAVRGGRPDRVRIGLTTLGSALGTLTLASAITVAWITPDDGPYHNELLSQPGLHRGVVFALVLLSVPVIFLVGQCARVGTVAKDRRLAAMRLGGATPADVRRIAAAEAGLSALAGSALGLLVYFVARLFVGQPHTGTYVTRRTRSPDPGVVIVTEREVTGSVRSLPTDVLPPWWTFVIIPAAIVAASAVFTILAMRRVEVSPFGVARGSAAKSPRYRAATLFLAGCIGMASFGTIAEVAGVSGPTTAAAGLFVLLLLMTAAGLLLGAAALSVALGRFIARRTPSPSLLLASRRLVADPYAASRASAAVLLTLLVGGFAQGVRAHILATSDPSDNFYDDALNLVNLAIAVSALLAVIGVFVGASESIVSRRRTIALQRATGVPTGVVRRAAIAEVMLPIVPAGTLAAIAGLLAARGMFGTTYTESTDGSLASLTTRSVPLPWLEVTILLVATIAAAMLISAAAAFLTPSRIDISDLRAAA